MSGEQLYLSFRYDLHNTVWHRHQQTEKFISSDLEPFLNSIQLGCFPFTDTARL